MDQANDHLVDLEIKLAYQEQLIRELDEEAADRRHRESMRGDEIKEGIKAFAEKRPPRF